MSHRVKAEWDAEANVRVASSDDAPSLATGAGTFEGRIDKLTIVIPELLLENCVIGADATEVPFEVTAVRSVHAPIAA